MTLVQCEHHSFLSELLCEQVIDFGVVDEKLNTMQQHAFTAQKVKRMLECITSSEANKSGRRFCPSAALTGDHTYSAVPRSEGPSVRRRWTCWSRPRGNQKDVQRLGVSLLWRQRGSWGCPVWRRLCSDFIASSKGLQQRWKWTLDKGIEWQDKREWL